MGRVLELLVPSCDCPGGERGWNLSKSPVTNGLISHAYVMKSPENPKKRGLESFWVGELVVLGEWCTWEGMEAPHPIPMLCPIHLFCPGVPELYPFILNW